jgi:hypothetical protein
LFVRSRESLGWVHEGDLPAEKKRAVWDRLKLEGALLTAYFGDYDRLKEVGSLRPKIDANGRAYYTLLDWKNSFPEKVRAIGEKVRADQVQKWLRADDVEVDWRLYCAGAEEHPGWELHWDRGPRRIDDNAPSSNELVEWFVKNFPEKARAIESRVRTDLAQRRLDLSTTSAARALQQLRRERRWDGRECMIKLRETEVDALVAKGLLSANERKDPNHLLHAIYAHLEATLGATP